MQCECFWGDQPSRFVVMLRNRLGTFAGLDVLDAGCGEGRNGAFVASLGGRVLAIDVSSVALHNGRRRWEGIDGIDWILGDVGNSSWGADRFDVVIAYGLLHCISRPYLPVVLDRLQKATKPGGYNVVCAFNDRLQDLMGHPAPFRPTLLPHQWYLNQYVGWQIVAASDEDLYEQHPPINVNHGHALTRILARRDSTS
jgi:tellurite methyltransferase